MKIIEKALKSVREFDIMDFAFFKICVFSLGIITGVHFFRFFRKKEGMLWGVFGTTWIYTMCRVFTPDEYKKTAKKVAKKGSKKMMKKVKKLEKKLSF